MSTRKPSPQKVKDPRKLQGRKLTGETYEIDIDRIRPDPEQPRKFFDDLLGLSTSLKQHGQLQAITVRWSATQGCYLIVAGERRYRAAEYVGLKTLKCVIIGEDRPVVPEADVLELQLVENIQRQEMLPMETAAGIRRLMQLKGINATQAAACLGMNKSTVSKLVALLDLPPRIQTLVDNKQLTASTAYEISKLGDEAEQVKLAERSAASHLTRDQVAAEVTRIELAREGRVTLDDCTLDRATSGEKAHEPGDPVELGGVVLTINGPKIEMQSDLIYLGGSLLKPSLKPSPIAFAEMLESLARNLRHEAKKLTWLFGENGEAK